MIANTTQIEVPESNTISYSCQVGYESANPTHQSVTVTCSSNDTDNIPWTWNDTSVAGILNCTRGNEFC